MIIFTIIECYYHLLVMWICLHVKQRAIIIKVKASLRYDTASRDCAKAREIINERIKKK